LDSDFPHTRVIDIDFATNVHERVVELDRVSDDVDVVNVLKDTRRYDEASVFATEKDKLSFRRYEEACDRVKGLYAVRSSVLFPSTYDIFMYGYSGVAPQADARVDQTDEAKRRSVWRLRPEPGRSAARAGRGLASRLVRRGQHAR
jgi:hypothetical protein